MIKFDGQKIYLYTQTENVINILLALPPSPPTSRRPADADSSRSKCLGGDVGLIISFNYFQKTNIEIFHRKEAHMAQVDPTG